MMPMQRHTSADRDQELAKRIRATLASRDEAGPGFEKFCHHLKQEAESLPTELRDRLHLEINAELAAEAVGIRERHAGRWARVIYFRRNPMLNVELWAKQATRGLDPEDIPRIREEILLWHSVCMPETCSRREKGKA